MHKRGVLEFRSLLIAVIVIILVFGGISLFVRFTQDDKTIDTTEPITDKTQLAATTPPAPTAPTLPNEKYGIIDTDETWSGTIHVTGDIIVKKGATLTILPGTTVLVAANSDRQNLDGRDQDPSTNLDFRSGIAKEDYTPGWGVHLGEPFRDARNHISINIQGKLNAVGTPEKRITITSDAENPTIYDWTSLGISEGNLSYADVSYYRVLGAGGDSDEGHQMDDIIISHNNLSNIGECGICANTNRAKIFYNNISYAGHALIDMHSANPTIRYNTLGPNPPHAFIVNDAGDPIIEYNNFIGEGVLTHIGPADFPGKGTIRYNTFNKKAGIEFGCAEPVFEQNNIYTDHIISGDGCNTGTINMSNNYWGEMRGDETIDMRITDQNDVPKMRKVIYEPVLAAPVMINPKRI
jgi:hypothetical protein